MTNRQSNVLPIGNSLQPCNFAPSTDTAAHSAWPAPDLSCSDPRHRRQLHRVEHSPQPACSAVHGHRTRPAGPASPTNPRADYSVAAYANGMRDLLSVLDIDKATVVGHSLGGGVAMQFAYQFPQMVERLILVGAGGVTGRQRRASVGSTSDGWRSAGSPAAPDGTCDPTGHRAGVGDVHRVDGCGRDIPNALRILTDLPEPTASAAFTRTLRAVVDWRGQVVTMLDRCYLTESTPVQLIWGDQDAVIPVSHAHLAHAAMPGSQLEIFSQSGHFPFHDDPDLFVEGSSSDSSTRQPRQYDQAALRELLRNGISERSLSGSIDTQVAVLDAMAPTNAALPDPDRNPALWSNR